jgi:hypothetical protein
MAGTPANHYLIQGDGIDGAIDTAGPTGAPVIDLQVDGRPVEDAQLDVSDLGIEVAGLAEIVPDARTVVVRLTLPQIDVETEPASVAGYAVLTTVRMTFAGPEVTAGPRQTYTVRPIAALATVIESLTEG